MKTLLILLLALSLINEVASQIKTDPPDTLLRLATPTTVRKKYVNFDVLKLMLGKGYSTDDREASRPTLCFKTQLLMPVALFRKNFVHLAYGFTIGSARMGFKHSKLSTGNGENSIVEDPANDYMVQKTTHIGIVLLPFIQPGKKKVSIFAGVGVDLNILGNKFFSKSEGADKRSSASSKNFVNKISVPLHLQFSYHLGNAVSAGFYSSYDMIPRFKDPGSNIHQFISGISIALII